jgi:MSHA biogenesis protein MshP
MYLKHTQQRGSALVIAVFIIVVMLALVLSLSRLLISSSETVVYEVQGTRALFAAQSGLEIKLTELFPITEDAAICEENSEIQFDTPGLLACKTEISCTPFPDDVTPSMYQLVSTGSCDAGGFITSRKVQIEVRQ